MGPSRASLNEEQSDGDTDAATDVAVSVNIYPM